MAVETPKRLNVAEPSIDDPVLELTCRVQGVVKAKRGCTLIPNHDPLKVGTLAAILGDVAAHSKLSRDEVLERLFGRG